VWISLVKTDEPKQALSAHVAVFLCLHGWVLGIGGGNEIFHHHLFVQQSGAEGGAGASFVDIV
jgi:hypothetical protein